MKTSSQREGEFESPRREEGKREKRKGIKKNE